MEKEFIVSIFGDSSVGKSSLLERYKPVCPFCSFQEALKLFQEEKLKKKEEKKDKEEEEDYETKAKVRILFKLQNKISLIGNLNSKLLLNSPIGLLLKIKNLKV